MLSSEKKKELRSDLFRHLDGLVIPPIAIELKASGLLDHILETRESSLSELAEKFNANEGYLNVGLRALASQGWLDYEKIGEEIKIKGNAKSESAFSHFHLYTKVVDSLKTREDFNSSNTELEPQDGLEKLFEQYHEQSRNLSILEPGEREIKFQILKHIEGQLISPTIVRLAMGGMFHKYFMEASFSADEYHEHPEFFTKILDFLTDLGWFEKNNNTYSFSEVGLFFAKRASAYGVTVSYLPMMKKLNDLFFGDANVLWPKDYDGPEIHVDRKTNVWGSGGAHSAYFKKIDKTILDIFNRPIEEQPKGILDMGCGNGAFLIHLFDFIEQNTLRGEMLEDHPLFLVGVDYNQAALKVTRANLIQADIWAKVIWGDISDPDSLASNLRENYKIELSELLNVRTFLDHNRIWSDPKVDGSIQSNSTGAFAYRGRLLSGTTVKANLMEHLGKWKQYISKHGLILIELHTIDPKLTASNIGYTAATAYDVTHGLSDQYILEVSEFQDVLKSLNLRWDDNHFHKFPNSDLATVSIHHILS